MCDCDCSTKKKCDCGFINVLDVSKWTTSSTGINFNDHNTILSLCRDKNDDFFARSESPARAHV